jgi:Lrp/AsnC family transcriptional regulator, leucine-responsive regulatory protein
MWTADLVMDSVKIKVISMDQKDTVFLAHLRRNARATLTDIGKKTGIPISTLYDRLQNLQENAMVKHTSLIDFSKLGYACRASIVFKVARESREPLSEYLRKHPAINALMKINNGYDFMVEGIFPNVKQLESMIEDLEERFTIIEKHVYYIIEDIVRENFLADPLTARFVDIPNRTI